MDNIGGVTWTTLEEAAEAASYLLDRLSIVVNIGQLFGD
eukprot:CAMPEP_0184388330 /NCGR_PEP_ID=MMETSP0007-20130409/11513_1 /TAXON_ID=97485 /ORGANISM="Prymnesium parvum, Strain Texoma1" /LENGTH=38 /DNA_ID= /DNA_START= /DNA_END= /DNA_ORIENTATION=